jgi:hypothetical protein
MQEDRVARPSPLISLFTSTLYGVSPLVPGPALCPPGSALCPASNCQGWPSAPCPRGKHFVLRRAYAPRVSHLPSQPAPGPGSSYLTPGSALLLQGLPSAPAPGLSPLPQGSVMCPEGLHSSDPRSSPLPQGLVLCLRIKSVAPIGPSILPHGQVFCSQGLIFYPRSKPCAPGSGHCLEGLPFAPGHMSQNFLLHLGQSSVSRVCGLSQDFHFLFP